MKSSGPNGGKMLRVISAVLFLLALVLFLVFWQQNYQGFDYEISIGYNILVFKLDPVSMPVWVLMILSFGCGIIITFLLELIGWFRTRSRLIQQTRTIRRMERELQDLRTMPFSDTGAGKEFTIQE